MAKSTMDIRSRVTPTRLSVTRSGTTERLTADLTVATKNDIPAKKLR